MLTNIYLLIQVCWFHGRLNLASFEYYRLTISTWESVWHSQVKLMCSSTTCQRWHPSTSLKWMKLHKLRINHLRLHRPVYLCDKLNPSYFTSDWHFPFQRCLLKIPHPACWYWIIYSTVPRNCKTNTESIATYSDAVSSAEKNSCIAGDGGINRGKCRLYRSTTSL